MGNINYTPLLTITRLVAHIGWTGLEQFRQSVQRDTVYGFKGYDYNMSVNANSKIYGF